MFIAQVLTRLNMTYMARQNGLDLFISVLKVLLKFQFQLFEKKKVTQVLVVVVILDFTLIGYQKDALINT